MDEIHIRMSRKFLVCTWKFGEMFIIQKILCVIVSWVKVVNSLHSAWQFADIVLFIWLKRILFPLKKLRNVRSLRHEDTYMLKIRKILVALNEHVGIKFKNKQQIN